MEKQEPWEKEELPDSDVKDEDMDNGGVENESDDLGNDNPELTEIREMKHRLENPAISLKCKI